MMLHDKIMPGQLLLDMRNDCSTNKLDIYNSYNFHHHHNQHQQQQQQQHQRLESEALDLSRRCDSVETRKTPSPYNSTSSFGTASPSTNCGSPQNLSQVSTTSSTPTVPTPLRPNKLVFSQANQQPPLAQGIASLYPLYYPNIKQENTSPPPQLQHPVMPTPLPHFPQNPAALLQQTFNNSTLPSAYSSSKSEDQQCRTPPSDAASILYPSILNAATTGSVSSGKTTRPFNAYPRDPLLVAAHFAASDVLWDKTSMERYSTYRKRALDDLRDTNGGHRIVTNPKMRRTNHRSQNSESEERAMESSDNDSSTGNGSSTENKNDNNNNSDYMNCSGGVKDEAYFERRRKNNAAAKKSRDRRRIKEDEIAIRAAYLERQNIELLCQIDALKKQLESFIKV